jgi:hypothetical protein
MDVTELWTSNIRIVEVGAPDGSLTDQLRAAGFERQLSIVDSDDHAQAIAARHPRVERFLGVSRQHDRVRQNNADVLILHGSSALKMLRHRDIRHARYVAVPLSSPRYLIVAMACGLAQFLVGRLTWPAKCTAGGGQARSSLLVYRVRQPQPHCGIRRFIPHSLGIGGFFAELQTAGLRHVVLRWFESLPDVPAGEDLDLLVDDAQLVAVRDLLDRGPGMQAVDLYSVNGAPGAEYRRIAYYPPYLAEGILARAVQHPSGCQAPSAYDHFHSLGYHALYHKGYASGLPSRTGSSRAGATARRVRPDHDYTTILEQLARRLGIDVAITLDDLHDYLDSAGWQPPRDTLLKLSRHNPWLRLLLGRMANSPTDAQLGVFLLRQAGLARGGVPRATRLIEQHGFQIIQTFMLTAEQAERARRNIRGGNWTAGPWKSSGGPPVAAIVAYDAHPIRPTGRERRQFPLIANARFLAKDQIRDAFNEGLPDTEKCNVVHSSDTDHEAIDYLRIILPDQVDVVLAQICKFARPVNGRAASDSARPRAA